MLVRLLIFFTCVAELLSSLVGVLTIGYYRPTWEFKLYILITKLEIKAKKKKEKHE